MLFILLSAVPLWGGLNLYLHLTGYFYAVYAENMEVGLIAEKEALDEVLGELEKEAELHYGRPVVLDTEVSAKKVFRPLQEDEQERVQSQLRHLLSYKVEARMVCVDEKEILPVSCDEQVAEVMEKVAGAYFSNEENVSLENVELKEKVSAEAYYCHPEEIRSVDEVATILLRGTDRRETYLASRGDSLWQIARDHDLSVEELKKANPQLNGDLIREGDELSLIVTEPLVNVVTVERVKEEENIPYDTEHTYDSSLWRGKTEVVEEGSFGIKEVTYQVTRKNGEEVEREKLGESIVKEPSPKVVAEGTANVPSRGTGTFIWPVQGGGRITSGYGWRNGSFHAGVDIAARTGTGIVAADRGVVVFSGWDGGYGHSIVIKHGTYYTRYAHNSSNLVSQGDGVEKGQLIGRIGSTGRSTGAHLHFEIRRGGSYGSTVNPLNYFNP